MTSNSSWRNACVSRWKNHDIKECLIKLTMLFYIFSHSVYQESFELYNYAKNIYDAFKHVTYFTVSKSLFFMILSVLYFIFWIARKHMYFAFALKIMGKSKLTVNLSDMYFHLIFTDVYKALCLFERAASFS